MPDINNGWMTVVEDNGVVASGEEVFIVCDQPHYAPDLTRVTCIGNNRWDPPIPTCTREGEFERETSGFCEIPRIRNGWITFGGDNRVITNGEEAFIVCDPPHYAPAQTRVTCIGNNRWDPPIPTCTWEGWLRTVNDISNLRPIFLSSDCSILTLRRVFRYRKESL